MGDRLRWRRAVAYAIALVVAAVVLTLAWPSPLGGGRVSTARHRVDLTGAVPWIAALAPPPSGPKASPTPPPRTDARPCRAADVSAALTGGDGAGGHSITYVSFTNTSASTCVLKGYPRVLVTQPGQRAVQATEGSWFPTVGTADMAPGQSTTLGIETDRDCAVRTDGRPSDGPQYRGLRITLPGGGTVLLTTGGLDVTCGVHLQEFSVERPPLPDPPDPRADLRIRLELPDQVSAGSTMTYVVALTNPTSGPISLDPCPGYLEATGPDVVTKQRYGLNCASVHEIPAGGTVRYAMRLDVPPTAPPGALTVRWLLDLPASTDVTARGTVRVTARR